MEGIKINIGKIIRELRLEKGLSARELSRRSGISQSYLSQLETGSNNNPTNVIINKLATGLNIPNGTLMLMLGYIDDPFDSLSQEEQELYFERQNEAYEFSHYELNNYPDIKRLLENDYPLINDVYYNKKKLDKEYKSLFIKVLNGLTEDLEDNYPTDDEIKKEIEHFRNASNVLQNKNDN